MLSRDPPPRHAASLSASAAVEMASIITGDHMWPGTRSRLREARCDRGNEVGDQARARSDAEGLQSDAGQPADPAGDLQQREHREEAEGNPDDPTDDLDCQRVVDQLHASRHGQHDREVADRQARPVTANALLTSRQ